MFTMSLRGCSRAVGSTVRLDWLFCCNPFDTILFAMRGFRCSGSGALLAPQTPCHIVCYIILLISNKGLQQDRRIHRSARLAVLLQFLYIIILYVWLGWRSGAGAFLAVRLASLGAALRGSPLAASCRHCRLVRHTRTHHRSQLINNKGLQQDRRIHRSARLLYIIILSVWIGWRSGSVSPSYEYEREAFAPLVQSFVYNVTPFATAHVELG